jgi:quercetin dioxygenase-like cupin family protein
MNNKKYEKNIMTRLREGVKLPAFRQLGFIKACPAHTGARTESVLWIDDDVIPGAFCSEYVWHFPGEIPGDGIPERVSPVPHSHQFDQVIGFVGSNQDDHGDLGGEVELWLEDQKFTLTRSFLVYIPAGMRHCPLEIRKVDRPIFQYLLGSGRFYFGDPAVDDRPSKGSDLSGQFVFDYKKGLVHPEYRGKANEVPGVHMHTAYLDGEVVKGANFYVESSWFGTAPKPRPEPGKESPGPQPHVHPFPELITFFGTNPEDVHDLGGEVELWIDGEQHIIRESCVVYIPENVVHCPLMMRNITRPIFHFTAGPGTMYV